MIISLHLPKTAGTSFAAVLQGRFGAELLLDYGDLPINTPERERCRAAVAACLANADRDYGNVQCIHGHFLPIKYLLMAQARNASFVTWMREPVERLLSHYSFWRRSPDQSTLPPLHRRFIEEDWSLERFCLGPELRNVYTQILWGFPLENFSFIGITESYQDDLNDFSNRFLAGMAPSSVALNVNDRRSGPITASLRQQIEEYHRDDVLLYRRVLAMRRARSE